MDNCTTNRPAFRAGLLQGATARGWVALIAALGIWAGFALSIRAIGQSPLSVGEVALIRFIVPALLLLPWLPGRMAMLRRVPVRHVAMIAAGAGLPFFLVAAAGGRATSAAHVSALVAGTTPLAVALLGHLLYRETVTTGQKRALAVIAGGVVLLVCGLGAQGLSFASGVALLLGASLMWGGYTLSLRRVALDPLGCTMLVTYPSLVMLAPLVLGGLLPVHPGGIDVSAALPFILVQGIGSGVLSTLTYAIAIRHLGAQRCASVGALAPVLATLLAVPLLGEVPGALAMAGVAAVTMGVLLFNVRRG